MHPAWIFAKYPNLVASLRRGELTADQASDASPGYLLLNLALGPDAVHWLQALVATATIACVWRVATVARGPVAGWVAALLLAVAQPWLIYSAVLEPDLLIGALNAAAILFLALSGPARLRSRIAAGVALGLSFALRPSVLPFAIAALAWLLVDRALHPASRFRHAFVYTMAFVIAALAPVALLKKHTGQQLGATMSAGQVFHQGHRPEDVGVRAHYPALLKLVEVHVASHPRHTPDFAHELYRRFAMAAAGEPLRAVESEVTWVKRALAFASEEPMAFVQQLARKLVMSFVAPSPCADIGGVKQAAQDAPVPSLPPCALALAGLAGLLLASRRNRVERLLGLHAVAYLVVYLVFYYMTRYGVALLPVWACLGGCAAAALWETRRDLGRLARRLAVAALPLALLLPGFVRNSSRLEERQLAVPVDSAIPSLLREGRVAEARDRYLDEQAAFPDHLWPWSSRGYGLDAGSAEAAARAADRARRAYGDRSATDAYLLAVLWVAADRCDLALPLLDRAAAAGFHGTVEDTDLALDPDLLASDCLVAAGQHQPAFARIVRSLEAWPGTLDGLSRAVAAAGKLGDSRRESWERKLQRLHDPASVHFALARAQRRWGEPEAALANLDWLEDHLPDARPIADTERAFCYLDLGRPAEALDAYARSMAIRFYVHGSRRFDPLVRDLVDARPDDPAAAFLAMRHWRRQGNDVELRAVAGRHPDVARALGL